MWPCAWCLLLCGDILTFFTTFTLFCSEVRWDYEAGTEGLKPWLSVVSPAPASLFSGRDLVCSFSCLLCLPLLLVQPGLGLGSQISQWCTCSVSGQERPGLLWRSAFTLQISHDRPGETDHGRKENASPFEQGALHITQDRLFWGLKS